MDRNDQSFRLYQQQTNSARKTSMPPASYGAATITPQPQNTQSEALTPVTDAPQAWVGQGQIYMDANQLGGASMPGALQYTGQFNPGQQRIASYDQSQNQHDVYGGSFFYAQQPRAQVQQYQQYQQPYEGRHASISSSSQLSGPTTPQLQTLDQRASSSRIGEAAQQDTSFSASSQTQAPQSFTSTDSMPPPSSFPGYSHSQHHEGPSTSQRTSASQEFEQYQVQVREIFTLVEDSQLDLVPQRLIAISRYLLGNAAALGLEKDDRSLYDERLKLWDSFNRTWLTTFQRQLDMTLDMLQHGNQAPPAPQTLISIDTIEELGQELVRLCDGIEKTGLVDYQMGCAEDEILSLIMRCIDLTRVQAGVHTTTGGGMQGSK